MNCEDCQQLLRAHVDGEVGLLQRLAVLRHLRRCIECAGRARSIGAVTVGLRALDAPAAAPAYPARRPWVLRVARLLAEAAVALAIGLAAFAMADAALGARRATRPVAQSVDVSALTAQRPQPMPAETEDLLGLR